MSLRLGPGDYRDMPWKNGGGVTRELFKLPHPTDPERFLARLTIATIASSGPFSSYPGVDRTLMLLDGPGVALSFGGGHEVRLDRPLRPIAFPGETPVMSRLLAGPVTDFNLMVDRASASATLSVAQLAPGESGVVAGSGTVILYGLGGAASAGGQPLSTHETLCFEARGPVSLESERGARLVVVRLALHDERG